MGTLAEEQNTSQQRRIRAKGPKAANSAARATAASGLTSSSFSPSFSAGRGDARRRLLEITVQFDDILGQCLLKAGAGKVHRIRVGSRRIEAMVGMMARQAEAGDEAFEKPARAWLRQLKEIRRAAGPVRDLDVHRELLRKSLQRWKSSSRRATAGGADEAARAAPPVGRSEAPQRALRQVEKQACALDGWLKDRRRARAEMLQRVIGKRRGKLAKRQKAFFAAANRMENGVRRPALTAAAAALQDFVRVSEEMPSLDASNLHHFRKLTKRSRYLAETDMGDGHARTIAKALKRAQDAIGDWHDWHSLASEARIARAKNGAELLAWLEGQVNRSLADALETTARMRGKLLQEWMAGRSECGPGHGMPRKLPSRSLAAGSGDRERAGSPARGVA